MRWNFAHILNKSLIRPISYENSLWSLSKTKVFEAQTFVQLGCEFIQNMAKFQCITFGCLFIFYHILKDYSWPTYKFKIYSKLSANSSIVLIFSSFIVDLIVTAGSTISIFLNPSTIPFMIFAAIGAHDPFSINATLRF